MKIYRNEENQIVIDGQGTTEIKICSKEQNIHKIIFDGIDMPDEKVLFLNIKFVIDNKEI